MKTVAERHAWLKSSDTLKIYEDYAELATYQIRRVLHDVEADHQGLRLDFDTTMMRLSVILTCIEATAPHLERYDIGPDMPYAGGPAVILPSRKRRPISRKTRKAH